MVEYTMKLNRKHITVTVPTYFKPITKTVCRYWKPYVEENPYAFEVIAYVTLARFGRYPKNERVERIAEEIENAYNRGERVITFEA